MTDALNLFQAWLGRFEGIGGFGGVFLFQLDVFYFLPAAGDFAALFGDSIDILAGLPEMGFQLADPFVQQADVVQH